MTVDLFAIGNALIDQEFTVSDDFLQAQGLQKGTMQLTDGETQIALFNQLQATQNYKGQASGGSAANSTVAFSALGGSAFYGCRVGNDDLGEIYLKGLNDAGIQTSGRSISNGLTGTCMVLISPDSERTMHTYLGITAELTDAQIDFGLLSQAKWLYLEGYLSTSPTARVAVQQARQLARRNGVKIALSLSDPAMVQYAREGLTDLLGDGVDLLFCNEQEALMFSHAEQLSDAISALSQLSQSVVITQGAAGATVVQGEQTWQVAGRSVTAVDTNGAGDAFAGAYLFGIKQNLSPEHAAQLAVLISSEVVAQYGPRLSVPHYSMLYQQFVQQHAL